MLSGGHVPPDESFVVRRTILSWDLGGWETRLLLACRLPSRIYLFLTTALVMREEQSTGRNTHG